MKYAREDLHRQAWKYLNLLRTPRGAKFRLDDSGRILNSIDDRAETLATITNGAFESYQEYLASKSIISHYYMSFKLIQALLVSVSPNVTTLGQLQNSSKFGHGIKMYLKDRKHFPNGIFFWYQRSGMLSDLMRFSGWDESFVRIDGQNEIERAINNDTKEVLFSNNIFNVNDLIVRIPELRIFLYELGSGKPLFFRTGQGEGINDPGAEIYFDDEEWKYYSQNVIERFIGHYNRPRAPYNETINGMRKFSPDFEKVFHYPVQIEIPLYNYWVVKLGNISDMLAIYFTLLYILSILVRYYPAEWSRITSGETSLHPLIDAFTESSLNGITMWVCNNIFGKRVVV